MSADSMNPDSAAVGSFEDANLRALAIATDLPGGADAASLARWKGGDGAAPASLPITGRRHRLRRRLLAAGSAIAACAAVAGVLFIQGRSSQVEAATIIRSLRQAMVGGFNVSLRGVAAKHFAIEGDIKLRFDRPLNLEAMIDDTNIAAADPGVSTLHGELTVHADNDSMIPGLNLRLEFASTPQSTWAFVKSNNPNQVAPDPHARRIMGFLTHGVMLDLGEGGMQAIERLGLDADGDPVTRGTVSIRAGSGGIEVDVDRDGDPSPVVAEVQTDGSPASRAEMVQHNRLLRAIVSGRASEQELQEMLDLLQRHAADATVEPQGNGRYLLKVLIDPDQGPAGPPEFNGAMIEVSYVQEVGVEWAEFHTSGELTGTMRVEFSGDVIEPELLDKSRVIEPGRTMIVTPEIIQGFLGTP